jgi:signal transduction histidine kinase
MPEAELVLYRIGQEALSNVSLHAHATHVQVRLQRVPGAVELEVRDDGVGFDVQNVHPATGHGLGLVGMRERVATIGGTLIINSQPGHGTAIVAHVPAPQDDSNS